MRRYILGLAVASLAIFGCDDGGGDDGDAEVIVIDVDNGIADLGTGGAGGGAVDMTRPDPDRGVDAATGGSGGGGGIRDIETCPEICSVYETCGRIDDIWSGSYDACQTACDEGSANERFAGYRACMQITPCDRLEECVVPSRPLPSCEDVCAAAEACEDAPRLPAGLPEFADCAAACEDATTARHVAQCGQNLVEEGVCDEPLFSRCILDLHAANCVAVCEARAGCDESVDIIDCTIACNLPVEDPLAQRRHTRLNGCLQAAVDCEDVTACEAGALPPAPDVAALCAANAQSECDFFDAERCEEVAAPAVAPLMEGSEACLTDGLDQCDSSMAACFQTAPPPADGCRDHCEFSLLCGLLEGDGTELDCRTDCQTEVEAGTRAGHWMGLFECTRSATCAELESCQTEGTAEVRCAAFCAAKGACDEGLDADACAATCVAGFATRRTQGALACVAAAGSCEAIARCEPAPAPDCSLVCDPQVACTLAEADACQLACDDAEFANPEGFLPLAACLNADVLCSARATCVEGDLSGADACLAWCAQRACGDEAADVAACALACAREGVPGEEGLVFAAAEACLAEADRADCDALNACVAVDPTPYCESVCAEELRCGLIEDAETCATDCAANGEVEPAVCALNAMRRNAGCAPVAACLNIEVPPASAPCVELCAAQNLCDEGVDPFLCERECVPEPEGIAVRAACARFADCEQLPTCLASDGVMPEGCATVCDTVAACDGLIGEGEGAIFPEATACQLECAGHAVLEEDTYPGALNDCAAGAECEGEDVFACFESPAGLCDVALQAITDCGLADLVAADPAQFMVDCATNLAADPATTEAQIQCLVEGAPDGMACITCLLPAP